MLKGDLQSKWCWEKKKEEKAILILGGGQRLTTSIVQEVEAVILGKEPGKTAAETSSGDLKERRWVVLRLRSWALLLKS